MVSVCYIEWGRSRRQIKKTLNDLPLEKISVLHKEYSLKIVVKEKMMRSVSLKLRAKYIK